MNRLSPVPHAQWCCCGTRFGAGPSAAAGGLDSAVRPGRQGRDGIRSQWHPQSATLQADGKLVIVGTNRDFNIATPAVPIVR